MKSPWESWTEHVMHCAKCSHAARTVGNLDKGFLGWLCEEGRTRYETYRRREAGLSI